MSKDKEAKLLVGKDFIESTLKKIRPCKIKKPKKVKIDIEKIKHLLTI